MASLAGTGRRRPSWWEHYGRLRSVPFVPEDADLSAAGLPANRKCSVDERLISQAISIDEYLDLAGGWGPFQGALLLKVSLLYAFLGVDNLLSAFLAPALGEQWSLSLVEQQLCSSLWFVGGLVGFLLSGALADARGRRPALAFFATLRCFGDVLTFASPTLGLLLAARVVTSVGTAGAFNVCLPILTEHSPPNHRARVTQALGFVWQLGVLFLVAVAYVARHWNWRSLGLALAPSFPATVWLLRGLPESPRFFQAKGRSAEAMGALLVVARANGLPQADFELPRRIRCNSVNSSDDLSAHRLVAQRQASRTAAIFVINLVSSGTHYGVCFAPLGHLGANVYLTQVGATLLEVPAVLMIAPLADNFGRRKSLTGLFVVFALALALLEVLPADAAFSQQAALLVARGAGQAVSTLKWVVNAENFPTPARGAGLAFAGICGQLGGIIGPLTFATTSAPFLAMALSIVPAVLCTLSLPETAGEKLG
mmetsp:Transcript_108545/g.305966  ORF Transcript_108545/g.305966 Transcript_108545/m.305966 type:complete len:483 (-) Transcript_108545:109-1557(-)